MFLFCFLGESKKTFMRFFFVLFARGKIKNISGGNGDQEKAEIVDQGSKGRVKKRSWRY